jgi:hypothetical protein
MGKSQISCVLTVQNDKTPLPLPSFAFAKGASGLMVLLFYSPITSMPNYGVPQNLSTPFSTFLTAVSTRMPIATKFLPAYIW